MDKQKEKKSNTELLTNSQLFPTTTLHRYHNYHHHRYQHSTPNHPIDSNQLVLSTPPLCFLIKDI